MGHTKVNTNATTGIIALGIFAGVTFFGVNNPAYADVSLSINTPANPVLEITLSTSQLNLNLTPKPDASTFGTADLTVSAGTNNPTGYALSMQVADTTLSRTEELASHPLNSPTIPSLTVNAEGYTQDNFTRNRWGYRIGNGNFLAIPTESLTLSSSPEATNGAPTTITFASKVDMSLPAGSYSTDIEFIAVTNAPAPTMQDIDTWRGSLVTNRSIQARDERDGKYYWVTKLQTAADNPFARADNNGNKYQIWMTQNLDLDLDTSKPLVSTTSDLNTTGGVLYTDGYTNSNGVISWTPVNSTTTDMSDITYDDAPHSLDAGTRYTYKDSNTFSTECNGDDCMHWHVGNYYTGAASVAANDVGRKLIEDYSVYGNSICPKNWRLPTGPRSASGYSDFNYLLVQHNIISEYVPISENTSWASGGYSNIQDSPLYITRSGYWHSSNPASVSGVNEVGGLYSNVTGRQLGVDGNMALFFNSSYVTPVEVVEEDIVASDGLPVRCIAREPDSTITFDANGGTGTMNPQTLREGTGTLNSNTFTRANYDFNGWNTAADGSGTSYANGAIYTGPSTTLYAQWKLACSSTISGYMQNIGTTSSYCDGASGTMTDSRDDTVYHVAKLADGKIWMLDNLAIDLTNSTVKSKLSASNTNATATSISRLINGGGTSSDQYATAGVANWTSSYSYSAPLVNMTDKDVIPSNAPTNGAGYNKVGGYYNFCAASAGSYCYGDGTSEGTSSGNATEDICPKNWRMPTSNTGEYGALANAIYGSTSSISDATQTANFRNALSLPLSGFVLNGLAGSRGSNGYFWSSTRLDDSYMFSLYVRTSTVAPSNGSTRSYGSSIRCLAGV